MSPQCGQRVRSPGGSAVPAESAHVRLLPPPSGGTASQDESLGPPRGTHAPASSHIHWGEVSMSRMTLAEESGRRAASRKGTTTSSIRVKFHTPSTTYLGRCSLGFRRHIL